MLSKQPGCLILKVLLFAFVSKAPIVQFFSDVIIVSFDLPEVLEFERQMKLSGLL